MRPSSWETRALAALLVVHTVLGVYYAVTIPIFESYDEIGHYRFVRYVADERRLPDPTKPLIAENDETHQPPLYYLLAAIPLTLTDLGEDTSPKLNPHMWSGPVRGGPNRVVHDPVAERWPYRGTTLAVRLARLASVVIAAFGLVFTYAAARTAFPDDPWVRWGATWLVAFWPQYRFLSAVITNDIMVTVCGAAVTWLLLRVVASDQPNLPDISALGLATALALLAKNNALGLLPPVLVVVGLTFFRSQSAHRKKLLLSLAGAAGACAVAIGWWYARNINSGVGALGRYRSFSILLSTVRRGFLADPSRWGTLLPAFATALPTLWASFGWGNISLPEWVSWSALGWSTLAMVALIVWVLRRRGHRERVAVLLLVIVSVSAISVTHIVSLGARIVPGRYLLPALPALCMLLAAGWSELFRGRGRLFAWAASGGALLVLSALIPALYIAPAYSPPPRLPEAQLAEYTPIHCTFGDFAELVGYRMQDPFVASSDEVRVSLAWRVLDRADADYSLAVQVFEGERELIGEVHRFPGHGALATSTWEPGYTFREDLVIPIESHIAEGHLAWIEVSFYEHQTLAPVPVFDPNGTNVGASVRMAQLKVRAKPRPDATTKQSTLLFGPAIGLVGTRVQACLASPAPSAEVELEWLAIQSPETDYKVSIQLRDAEQTIVSQVDELPRQGINPTRFWEPGEIVADHHTLPLPALLPSGTYTMYVCLYDSVSLQRLPVTDLRGKALPLAEVPLLTLTQEAGKDAQVLPVGTGDHTPFFDSSCEHRTTAAASE